MDRQPSLPDLAAMLFVEAKKVKETAESYGRHEQGEAARSKDRIGNMLQLSVHSVMKDAEESLRSALLLIGRLEILATYGIQAIGKEEPKP